MDFFAPSAKPQEKQITFERLQLTDERMREIEAVVNPDELEEELAQNVSKMKEYVLTFSDYLGEDERKVGRLSEVQSENTRGFKDNMGSLINFQKLSDELGYFKLIKMGIFALAMFILTMTFIFVDAFIF